MASKETIRAQAKAQRALLDDASQRSAAIAGRLFALPAYCQAHTVLCYLSFDSEVATDAIITHALSVGKRVAVPYCTAENGEMSFYLITSLDGLRVGYYGVRVPDMTACERLTDYTDSVVLVPGLCFDENGNRLGYGKGYYDRFLENYPFISVGLCYNSLIKKQLPTENYDKPVDYIITENRIITVNQGGKNG